MKFGDIDSGDTVSDLEKVRDHDEGIRKFGALQKFLKKSNRPKTAKFPTVFDDIKTVDARDS